MSVEGIGIKKWIELYHLSNHLFFLILRELTLQFDYGHQNTI